MGRGKSGRDLQFLFLFFQQNCFHMSGNFKYFAIFWFMGLACLASLALIYLHICVKYRGSFMERKKLCLTKNLVDKQQKFFILSTV
jgi:hypothetical protein